MIIDVPSSFIGREREARVAIMINFTHTTGTLMRKAAQLVVVCVIAFAFVSLCSATDEDYALMPGAAFTLTVDQLVTVGDRGIHQIDILDKVAWTVNGKPPGSDPSEGNLTIPLTVTSATYKAPHTVPKVNPVAVAISVLPQGPIKNKITLICNVTVVDRTNAFSVTGPKVAFGVYYLDDRYSSAQVQSMLARAYMAGPELAITVSAMQPGGAGGGEQYHGTGMMSLFVNSSDIGDHKWALPTSGGTSGPGATTVMLTITVNGVDMYSTGDCLPHGDNNCKPVSTKGLTRITAFDKKTNEISGSFEGQVVKLANGRPSTYAQASGTFKTTLQSLVPEMK